jgi:hypothetical protein
MLLLGKRTLLLQMSVMEYLALVMVSLVKELMLLLSLRSLVDVFNVVFYDLNLYSHSR